MAHTFNLLREDQMTLAQLRARRFVAVGRRRAKLAERAERERIAERIAANLAETERIVGGVLAAQ